jgi:hypothetical protein
VTNPTTTPVGRLNGAIPTSPLASSLPTRNRPKGYIALAVALIVGLGALGYWAYTQAGQKVPVVMAARDIPLGHVIERPDLTTVEVAGGVTAVSGAHLDSLLGQSAAVGILSGTLVQRAMVRAGSPIGDGQALVGVAASPGQVPSSGLSAGDTVNVLALPQKGADPTAAPAASPVLASGATVFDVRANPSQAGGSLLTLLVPADAAFAISAASNSGLIALVRVGG